MSQVNLKIYPALNGDSFLLSIDKIHLLIDGGYVNTYNEFIKPDLLEISKRGECLSHVIVTHIDQDHISGIVKLFEENQGNKVVHILNVWHNSYRHIQGKGNLPQLPGGLIDGLLEEIKGGSYLKEINEQEKQISGKQGSSLASLILEGKYAWNSEYDGKAITIDTKTQIQINEDVKLIFLSPNNEKLSFLEKYWQKELKKNGYLKELSEDTHYDDAFEFMVARQKEPRRSKEINISKGIPDIDNLIKMPFEEDGSPSNGSSIAFIIENKEKRMLFLADAHPSLIVSRLKQLYPEEEFPLKFDLIKMSHHGSWTNNSPELLSIIDSDTYIFSTNGKGHGHPDEETIAHVISRKTDRNRILYINYPSEKLNNFNDENLRKTFLFDIINGEGKAPLEISL